MPNVRVQLSGVVLGVLEVEGVRVESSSSGLSMLLEKVAGELQRAFSVDSLAEAESTQAVRAMFRAWDVDPSKYRPSSEALRRRVVQGKGLYRVSNAVDIGNLGSIETGWPYGLYDRARIVPPIRFRHGASGEVYEGIGKRMWHLAGRPVLADANGPFGSPISDSTRTMITESTNHLLAAIYAPVATSRASIERGLSQLGERLVQFAAAHVTGSGLCSLNSEPSG